MKFKCFHLPPVVVALTKSDQFKGDVADVQDRIWNIVEQKGLQNVFRKIYVIDNTSSNKAQNEIKELRLKL